MSEEVSQENVDLALSEMRLALDFQHHCGDMLDQKAGNLINAAGFILAVVPSLQLILIKGSPSLWFWVGLAFAFVTYLLMVCTIIFIVVPMRYSTPLKADWAVTEELIHLSSAEARDTMLFGYIKSTQQAFDANNTKAFWLRIGYIALGLTVALLAVASVAMAMAMAK